MTRILINVWYPVDKAEEVYKHFLEAEKLFPRDPDLLKIIYPWVTYACDKKFKGAGIFEAKDEDFEQAIEYFVQRLEFYKNGVDGYIYEIAAPADNEKGKLLLEMNVKEIAK